MTDASALSSTPIGRLNRWWQAIDSTDRGLLMLGLLRVALALLFMLNVFPLDLRYRWYLHHGGDQDIMLALARSIIAGHPERALVGIGQPLVMVPWIVLLDPYNYFDIVIPLVLINGFLLAGTSVWLLGRLALKTIGSSRIALAAAAVWSLAPLITYYIFFWHYDPNILRSANVPKIGWLNGLSDGPAAFFMLLAVYLLAEVRRRGSDVNAWLWAGVGASISLSVLFRVHLSFLAAFLLIYVLIAHGWRALLIVCLCGLIMYVPQAWYNMVVFRIPITTGYVSMNDVGAWGSTLHRPLSDIIAALPFHPRHLVELWQRYVVPRPWLAAPVIGGAMGGLAVVLVLWRRQGWSAAALLGGTALAYLGPLATAWPFRDDVIRFSLPALPYLVILTVYGAGLLYDVGGQLRTRSTPRL